MGYETWTNLPQQDRQQFLSDNLAALVSGHKWPAATMTYGFLTDGDGREDFSAGASVGPYQFEPFSPFQQDLVRFVLAYIEAFIPIDFVETKGGDSHLGFGKYDMPYDGGYASYPSLNGKGAVFVDSAPQDNPTNGNPAELGGKVMSTIVHEIGHTLGLSHPVAYGDHEVHPDPLPLEEDSGILTVMSYRSWYHGEFGQGGRVWAPGPLDIAALLAIYGPRTSGADDSYRLTAVTERAPSVDGNDWQLSVAFPFVLVDTGGFDTVDLGGLPPGTDEAPHVFSFDTGLAASRTASGWIAGPTEFERLEHADGNPSLQIYPGTIIERVLGSSGVDHVMGNAANQTVAGRAGDDLLDGHEGFDVAQFAGTRSSYTIARGDADALIVIGADGTDTLHRFEVLKFDDKSYNLTIAGKAATVPPDVLANIIDLYVAYFNRVPEASGLSYWIDQYIAGKSLAAIAAEFYAAGIQFSETTGYTADMPLSDFIKVLYANVLGRSGSSAPPQADIDYWLDQVATGAVTREGMVARFLNDARLFYDDPNVGWVPRLLDQKVEFGKLHAVTYGLDYNDQQTSIQTTVDLAAAVTPDGYGAAVQMVGLSADDYLA